MKVDAYLHAALLLYGAEKDITEANIESVLKAAGVAVDSARAKVLAEALKGVDMKEALKNAAAPVAVAAAPVAAAAEAKKEDKKEDTEAKQAQAAEGLASLFG